MTQIKLVARRESCAQFHKAVIDQWDAYVAEWKAAGGDRLTEYAKTQLGS